MRLFLEVLGAPLTASEKILIFFCVKIWTIKKPALYLYHSAADVGGALNHN